MAKMAASFDVLCIQYHSSKRGVCNIVAFTKWDDWNQKFQIVDDVKTPDFGVIDDRVLDVAVDAFCEYGSTIFECVYLEEEDEEIREMFDNYVENCFIDEEATFRKWTKVKVDVRVEIAI